MRLRTIIFSILLGLGILPILTLVGVNLRDHIQKHEKVERQRTLAWAESNFITLNAHLTSLKKSLIQAAITPKTVAEATGHKMPLMTSQDHKKLGELISQLLENDSHIIEVQLVDLNGDEKVRLVRNDAELLVPLPDVHLQNYQDSPLFWKGLQLDGYEMDGLFSDPDDKPMQGRLTLVTPVIDSDQSPMGLVFMVIDTFLFLAAHQNAYWVLPEGVIIHVPPIPIHKTQGGDGDSPSITKGDQAFEEFANLKRLLTSPHPLMWENLDGRKITWLPVVFSENLPPSLWIGTPVDRSAAQEWKLQLIYNIVGIVVIIILVVAFIANTIAQKIDRIKNAILTGLNRILTQGEENVKFDWTGPEEVVNLAEELTTLAQHYTLTRNRQKEAEAALMESEDKFRNLTASAQDAIAMMDNHGDISYWNEAAADIFGYTEEEAIGKPIHTLISPRLSEAGQKESAARRKVSDGPIRETIELITKRKDGVEMPIELSLSEARIKDKWHSIWIIRDIAERKRAEHETQLQQQQLIQADKMISLGVLISGVAHEINNPNSITMLNTSMLHKSWESAKPILDDYFEENGDFLIAGLDYSEMRDQIPRLFLELEDSTKRIKNIVQDLKDYARQDTTRHMDEVDLNDVASAAIRLNQNKIKKTTKHFTAELADNLPPIQGNRQRLEQVLINLIQNSCEALTGTEKKIVLKTEYDKEGKRISVIVEDEGCGIPQELLNQITDPFFTTKRTLGGTGLGLSVSAGIVKEHNGSLHFDSKPDKGTKATVSFPLADDSQDAPPAAA